MPAGADPHSFEPSLRDRERLTGAGAVIANGAGLEGSLTDLVDTAAGDGVPVVDVADLVDVVASDPHVWQDPRRVIAALDAIKSAVVAAGRDAAAVSTCTDTYRAELTALDADIAATLAPIPPARRVMVTNHDAFGYFAERYDFQIIGTVIPSLSTLGESSADSWRNSRTRSTSTTCRRSSPSDSVPQPRPKRWGSDSASRSSSSTATRLESDGPAATYTGMMRANAAAIAAALS